jgi:hypothetical protein
MGRFQLSLHEQDLREQTRKAAQKRTPQMETRLSKGEKKNAKRMATVAAVYTIDTFGRTPQDLLPGNNSKPHVTIQRKSFSSFNILKERRTTHHRATGVALHWHVPDFFLH